MDIKICLERKPGVGVGTWRGRKEEKRLVDGGNFSSGSDIWLIVELILFVTNTICFHGLD